MKIFGKKVPKKQIGISHNAYMGIEKNIIFVIIHSERRYTPSVNVKKPNKKERKVMTMKRFLNLFLCLVLIFTAFAACSCGEDEPADSTSSASPSDASEAASTADESAEESVDDGDYEPNLPDKKFGGEEVIFLVRGDDSGIFNNWDLVVSESNTDTVNAAIEERNNYVESKYGVKIVDRRCGGSVNGGEMYTKILSDFNAQTTTYHVAYAPVYDAIALAPDGIFIDLNEAPNIDITAPWWDQKAMNSMSLAGRYYFGVGDISIQLYETLPCLVFNKDLAKQYNIENMYELVEKGEWTLDKLYQIAKQVSVDADDITGPSVGDFFGIGGQNDNFQTYFRAAGCNTVELNRYGEPTLTLYSERNDRVLSDVYDMITDQEIFLNCNDYVNTPGWIESPIEFVTGGFIEGRILFYSDGLLHLDEFADVDFDFGILPLPKYDKEQDEYQHNIGVWGSSVVCIPENNPDLEMATIIVEALGAKSKSTVTVEFFEKVLNIQSTRDEESELSLRIITSTKSFDMGLCFNWNNLTSIFGDMVGKRQYNFKSTYEAREGGIISEMNKTIQDYTDLPHYFAD